MQPTYRGFAITIVGSLAEIFESITSHRKPEPTKNRYGMDLTPVGELGLYEYTTGHRGTQIQTPFVIYGLPKNEERQILEDFFINGTKISPEITDQLSKSAQEAIHPFVTCKCLPNKLS